MFGIFVMLSVAGGALWWWNSQAPRRHLEDLIEQAYDHAEIDGPDAFSNFINRRSACTPSGEYSTDSDWRGSLGGLSRLESEDQAGPAAVRLADGLEADGWDVRRYILPDGAGDVAERRTVHAERGRDTIRLIGNGVAVNLSASTGPCNSSEEIDLSDPPPAYEVVMRFP